MLTSGTKLGPYEIEAPLGAGGMGEVYRARDTRLDRQVAIKVLPAKLAADPALKQRLEREAKAVSKLSHPHICIIHDIGHQDGIDFLVMEYLEGETLEKRLSRGALPHDQTVRYAAQIADALSKAHKLGITHRDLKPANVMLTKSGAKLMDFGLAKQTNVAPLAEVVSDMTQEHANLTSEGTIVGTFQYMAPEQLEGKEADARTDIFSFGGLMHEMATGKHAFAAKSRASLIAAILTAEPPPISQIMPMTPIALERVVTKCLAKDPDDRWQSASDLAAELNWIAISGSQSQSQSQSQSGVMATPIIAAPTKSERPIWIAAGVLLTLIAAFVGWEMGAQKRTTSPVHLAVALPAGKVLLRNSTEPVTISRDGSMIVYAAYGEDRKSQLYLRRLTDFESKPIPGTEGAQSPFFSPNGEWLGFFSDDYKMKKVLIRGGSPELVADQAFFGASWGDDDNIYYIQAFPSGIYKIPAAGGTPKQVTQTESTPDDRAEIWPSVLPGGAGLIFTVWTGKSFNESRIDALSFKTGKRKVLIEGGTGARYLSNGKIAYSRSGTLFVVGFDSNNLEIKGTPVPVIEGVMTGASNGDADFAASDNGTLIYEPGAFASFQRNLVWMDRSGNASNITNEVKPYAYPQLSRDGKLIAMIFQGSSFDVWVYDLERDTFTRSSFGGDDYRPHFSPDGKTLAYDSSKAGPQQIFVKRGVGQGEDVAVTSGPEDKQLEDWTPDGREVVFSRHNQNTGWDLYAAAIDGDHKLRPLVVARFNQTDARISPDGKWLAYESDESGQKEVFVQSMTDPGVRAQVSSEGGMNPRWAHSSNELLFQSKSRVMSVKFAAGGGLNPGKPVQLFEDKKVWTGFDIAPDGRLVVTREADDNGVGGQINVVTGWFDDLKHEERQ